MPHSSAPRRPRARLWYGPAPILIALGAWAALLVGWRIVVVPRLPISTYKFDPAVSKFIDVEGAETALYLRGVASTDALLVVGDSRPRAGISLRVLAQHGIAPAGLLTTGLAQLDHLLRATRTLPARRLLVCLSPASVYAKQSTNQAFILEQERSMRLTQRIDSRLDDELDVLRQSLLHPLRPARWDSTRPQNQADPDAQTQIYRNLLGKRTRAQRQEGYAALQRELRALQADGWQLACVRLPVSPSIHEVEERAFPAVRFERLCRKLEIPYLDLMGEPYDTHDGSHLIAQEAERASAVIAEWLLGLPAFLER